MDEFENINVGLDFALFTTADDFWLLVTRKYDCCVLASAEGGA